MASAPATLDDYLGTLTDGQRQTLARMRDALLAGVPDGHDGFGYGMPAILLDGKAIMWYAAWKQHYSIYPISGNIAARYASDLEGCLAARATVKFPARAEIPFALLTRLAAARAAELLYKRPASANSA